MGVMVSSFLSSRSSVLVRGRGSVMSEDARSSISCALCLLGERKT